MKIITNKTKIGKWLNGDSMVTQNDSMVTQSVKSVGDFTKPIKVYGK